LHFFALSVTTSLKIPGAVIPRRVFTRPGSLSTESARAARCRLYPSEADIRTAGVYEYASRCGNFALWVFFQNWRCRNWCGLLLGKCERGRRAAERQIHRFNRPTGVPPPHPSSGRELARPSSCRMDPPRRLDVLLSGPSSILPTTAGQLASAVCALSGQRRSGVRCGVPSGGFRSCVRGSDTFSTPSPR
jgi:hypothetical protein